jgi:hypothetical protein
MPGMGAVMGMRSSRLNRMAVESSSSSDSDADIDPASPGSARSMTSRMLEAPPGQEKAFVEPSKPPTPGSLETRFFTMESGDLLDTMGLSGMSIMCANDHDFRQLICVAAQSFVLQYTILYAFSQVIIKKMEENHERRLQGDDSGEMTWMLYFLLFVAVHLHFLSCFGDIPFSLNILLRIRDIHDTPKELLIAAPIFFIDALVTPMLQLVIGALFVCTSGCAVDVLLNSCAVAFISNIDNWILTLLRHMKILSGVLEEVTVHVPYNAKFSSFMEMTVVICPVMPVVFTASMIRWGETLGITPHGSGGA